jgi:TRAP-type C4-dicarboxylate transport system permease small subunit
MVKVIDRIESVFLNIAVVSLLIMACLTSLDAMGRYLLNWPIIGAYEISERYLMIFCFYFAISYSYREGANIRIILLVSRLPKQAQQALRYVIQAISILFCLFLFIATLIRNLPRLDENLTIVEYTIPLGPAFLLVNIGLLMLSLRMILDLWQIKHGKSGLFKDEQTEESPTV